MKKIIISILLAGFSYTSPGQSNQLLDTTGYFSFHLNYWFNMHHFLWLEAYMNVKGDSTIIDGSLLASENEPLKEALNYYGKELVNENPRMSDYMSSFKSWVTGDDFDLKAVPEEFREHMEVLEKFDKTYQEQFWTYQKQFCEKTLQENLELIRSTEASFVDRITQLTRQFWQFSEKVKVDVTYAGQTNSRSYRITPYTTIFPTHVVMNTLGQNDVPGNWVEILYHESAHHLILSRSYFVGGTLRDLAEAENLQLPRQLWHAYLFYFTGQISQTLFNESGLSYPETYMERNRVFSDYFPLLEKYLKPYMGRKSTLVDATRALVNEYNDR